MVIHNVYFWVKSEVDSDSRDKFKAGIQKLIDSVPTIKNATIGHPAGTPNRDVVDHSFDFSMFLWFDSVEDHNTYQVHQAHKEFVADFNHLWERVQVLDSES